MADFYTFRGDLRPFGNGTPVAFKYTTPGSGGDIEQGEMVAWDASGRVVIRNTASQSTGKFIGVARDSAKGILRLGNQAGLALKELSVFTTGIHDLVGTAGDTYSHGDKVYMGADTVTVKKTQATGDIQVGTVHLPDGSQKSGAVRVSILIDEFTKTQS